MRNHDETTGRVLGTLHSLGNGTGKVRMESVYPSDPDGLWAAISEPDRLARWIADVDGDLRVGGTVSARFTSGWEGPGRIDVCDPPRRLVVTMSPETDDETVIEAVLSPETDGTRLVVEESGIPLPEISGHGAGWQAHMDDLTTHLTSGESPRWQTRWAELASVYQELAARLG
jgi:uncharacterized protein YndB with AHSA1/START domain